MKVLIFGGTREARELASRLVDMGDLVTTTLAGRTTAPATIAGEVRSGGFGGVENIAAFIREESFDHLIDATHPYAASISHQLAEAARIAGVPLIRLQRPAWTPPGEAEWHGFANLEAALAALPEAARVFLTTGHKELEHLATRPDCKFLIRLIEPPGKPLPANAELIITRPPYNLAGETELMRRHRVTHLLTKNAGGAQTRAKIDAAAALGVTTYILRRPDLPHVPEAASVAEAVAALHPAAS